MGIDSLSTLPDARQGLPLAALDTIRPTLARFGNETLVLIADGTGGAVALAARCPHAGAPLAAGRVLDGCLRCPWHHAAFRLTDGVAEAGPTVAQLACYRVEVSDGQVRVLGRQVRARPRLGEASQRIVIVGGGAAAHGALAELAAHRFPGEVVLLAASPRPLTDRTQLSKMALAGASLAAELPALMPARLRLLRGHRAEQIQRSGRQVMGRRADGSAFCEPYDLLLLATGARARTAGIAGADAPGVQVLRGQEDLAALSARAVSGGQASLVGGGFISLEVAAALAQRGVRPHVLMPEALPLAHLLGEPLGRWLAGLHQDRGVVLHHGARLRAIAPDALELDDGRRLPTGGGPVVLGLGMQPRDRLAREAGLETRDGIDVSADGRTADPRIFAAGDAARPRDPAARQRGHWSAALWQGVRAVGAMLGKPPRASPAPLFWTRQFDRTVVVVGGPTAVCESRLYGDLARGQAAAGLWGPEGLAAVASVGAAATSLACAYALACGRPDDAERLLVKLGA